MAIQTVTINVEAQPTVDRIQTFLVLSQNENGRQIRFRILGDELPVGCTATLSGEKPDGNVWSKAGTVSDNFVTMDEDIQMTAVAGRWDAQLDIVHGAENIVTAPIRIMVEPAAVDAGAVPSDTQLEGYVEQCKQYAESAITDTTLTQSGKAADAKATGDAIDQINEDLGAEVTRATAEEARIEALVGSEVTRATAEEERIEALVESKPLPVAENITPIYVGDYLSPFNYLPSCCVRVGDYIYAIDSLLRGEATTSGSNAGKIRKFDLVNNVEDKSWEKTADVGHANSVAYDSVNEKFYVVPIWVYSVGQETDASFIYVFDSDFNAEGTIQTPSVAGRVSYDSVKNKLYYYDYHYRIFEYNGATWSVATVVDFTNISENTLLGRTYNQDFAVHDDQFYISSPYGMIVRGKLTPGTSHVDMCCITDYEDSNRRFILGELEGMEFSQDGHLYAVDYVTLSADIRNAFIVELPTSIVAPPSSNLDGPIFTAYDSTLTLSEATQAKFYLRTDEVRSILQLACRKFLSQSSAIFVPSGNDVTEPYPIRINRNLELILSGQYTVNKFNVLSGTLSISSDAMTNRLTFLTNETPITLSRNGGLKFAGAQPINVKLNNLNSGNGFMTITRCVSETAQN